MRKFLCFGKKLGAIGATAATFCSNTGSSTFPHGSSTVATLMIRRILALFPSKSAFFRSSGSSSSNTLPDFAQENRDLREGSDISPVEQDFPDSWELGDEYDEEDYEDWLSDEDWWDAVEDGENRKSWCAEAVDEAIDDEQPGEYPPGQMGDIPF